MKNFFIILPTIAACVILLSATCNDKEISLKKGESETRTANGLKYNITVTDILDNRCPKNVKCIRAGEAFVHTSLKVGNTAEQLLQFCTGLDCRRGTIGTTDTVTTSSGNIEIKLLSVEPYPIQTEMPSSKTAKFAVRKL